MKEILAALAALPALIDAIRQLASFLKNAFGDNYGKFLADSSEAFKKLNESKTPEEKAEAGKAIQDLISRL